MYQYKIVISDDEEFIRSGLELLISQEYNNVVITGSYTNGQDVLEHLTHKEVDILITDICMPGVTGLEIAKYIDINNLLTQTIMITGYQDFEYAHKAIEYKVKYLIVKPIDFQELLQSIDNIMSNIETKQNVLYKNTQYELRLRDVKRQNLTRLLTGDLFVSEIKNGIQQFSDNYDETYNGTCALLKIFTEDKRDDSNVKSTFWIDNGEWKNESIDVYYISYDDNTAIFLLLFNENIKVNLDYIAENFCADLCLTLTRAFKINYLYKFEIFESLESIVKLNKNQFTNMYIELALSNDKEGRKNILKMITIYCHINQLYSISQNIAKFLEEIYSVSMDVIMERIKKAKNKDDIISILYELDTIVDATLHNTTNNNFYIVEAIKKYVYENLSSEITLENVTKKFNISSAYFSRLFKAVTGEKFVDYMINVRILKAKELLKANKLNIRDIACKVGYSSQQYFGTVFKEKTGFTPNEYKRQSLNK
jgi:Response regulator containing CheY-like receiver domain and AraC-type DNA-binding domain